MARLHDVTFDCAHPASIARFWAAALEGYEVASYDDAELERLRSMGIDDPEDDPSVLVQPVDGSADTGRPRLWFTRVPESKVAKNRVHLDLRCLAGGADAEVDRLRGLGATVVSDDVRDDGGRWVILQDPEGNEFCLEPVPAE